MPETINSRDLQRLATFAGVPDEDGSTSTLEVFVGPTPDVPIIVATVRFGPDGEQTREGDAFSLGLVECQEMGRIFLTALFMSADYYASNALTVEEGDDLAGLVETIKGMFAETEEDEGDDPETDEE